MMGFMSNPLLLAQMMKGGGMSAAQQGVRQLGNVFNPQAGLGGQGKGMMPAQPAQSQTPEKEPWLQQKGLGGFSRGDLLLAGMGMLSGKNFQEGLGNASGIAFNSIERQRADAEKQKKSAALLKYMTANGKMAPEAAAALAEFGPEVAIGQMNRSEDISREDARFEKLWLRDEGRYETEQERLARLDQQAVDWRNEDVGFREGQAAESVRQFNLNYGLNKRQVAAAEGKTGSRQLSPEEVAAAGYPAGSVVQVDGQGNHQVRYKPEPEFTAGQKNKYINDAAQLEAYQATLDEYLALVDQVGLKQFYAPDDPDVAKLEAMQQSLSFGAKDLFQLGVLSKDDYEAINRIIPDATGPEAWFKNKKSFKASAQPLQDYIGRAYNAVPEQFRNQGDAQTVSTTPAETPVAANPVSLGGQYAVTDAASYEAVPDGAYYRDPNGQVRQKPHYLPIGGK